MKIAVVSVFVHNPLDAFKVYTEKLGFIERLYLPEHWVAIVASAEEPQGTGILLEPNQSPIAQNYQNALRQAKLPCIVFSVANLDKEYERLKELGFEFQKPPTKSDWGYDAVFDDTCGNYIQLQQLP